jgi:uncharacterized membrane protein YphA (DoxX/SURF4 family)
MSKRDEESASARSRLALNVVRICLGVFFLFEGMDKAAWLANPSLLVTNSLQNWARNGVAISRWYIENVCIPGAPVFARLVFLGEVATGIALLLGFWTRRASVVALFMVLNIHFAHSSLFKFGFLSQGDGLPVLAGLLALAIGGEDFLSKRVTQWSSAPADNRVTNSAS